MHEEVPETSLEKPTSSELSCQNSLRTENSGEASILNVSKTSDSRLKSFHVDPMSEVVNYSQLLLCAIHIFFNTYFPRAPEQRARQHE